MRSYDRLTCKVQVRELIISHKGWRLKKRVHLIGVWHHYTQIWPLLVDSCDLLHTTHRHCSLCTNTHYHHHNQKPHQHTSQMVSHLLPPFQPSTPEHRHRILWRKKPDKYKRRNRYLSYKENSSELRRLKLCLENLWVWTKEGKSNT